MIVKKYTASSVALAMKKVHAELGSEAVILSTKRSKQSGMFSLFKKKSFEIVAAIEKHSEGKKGQSYIKLMDKKQEKMNISSKYYENNNQNQNDATLLNEVKELKEMIVTSKRVTDTYLPNQIKQIQTMLHKQELEEEIVNSLVEFLLKRWYKETSTPSFALLQNWVKEYFREQLQHSEFGGIRNETKYVFLFGPTGVGKTTTIAKLAGEMLLKKKKTIAFITLDTYRIAAVEQLKTYANILEAPLKVCYNVADFNKAKEELDEYDIIFIDTAGRNYYEKQYVDDIETYFSFSTQSESYFVLSATSKYADMLELLKRFEKYPIEKIIVTKTDETRFLGPIFNVSFKTNMQISYITNGQNVPEDIIETDEEKLVEMITGGI